jgi:formyltetrahydrofolate-dependent phosphoribosylglycinamide formyltransferase
MVHNKKNCGAVERAERLGIPHVRLKTKQDDERIELFKVWRVDYIILAGYMRILSPKFINAFPNKIINIHPSLLPKYKGLNAIGQAFESGDRNTGCTVHYVTEELDSGTIIEQSIVPICPDDTVDTLTHRVQQAEHRLLPLVINAL